MNKIVFLKFIDSTIGKALLSLIPVRKNLNRGLPAQIRNILVIRPGGIGDFVLLIPTLQNIRSRYPLSKIDILCEKRNAGVAALAGDINHIYLYDRGLDIFRCLRNTYDILIDTEQWHRLSACVSAIIRAKVKIGFATNERRKAYDHAIPYSQDEYEAYSFFRLIAPLACADTSFDKDRPFISMLPNPARTLLPPLQNGAGKCIAMFPGATVTQRKWDADRFGRVALTLTARGHRVVILGSTGEQESARAIQKLAPQCIDLTTQRTSLTEVAHVLKASAVLLTADSGLMHLAYALGTPTISLFGSGIEKKWAPIGKRHMVINKHLACSPCTRFGYTPLCKNNIECLNLIRPEEVLTAIDAVLLMHPQEPLQRIQ